MTTDKIKPFMTYIFVITFLFFMSTGFSQDIPSQISYQGKLSENNRPVNGKKKLNFSFFSESKELWSETHENVQVSNGLYHVILGTIDPIPLNVFENKSNVQLQIMVDDVVLLPNVNIVSVGYAFVAQKAVVADRLSGDSLFINQTMNVGIGTNDPKQKLDVSGGIHFGYTENDVPGSIRTDEKDIEFHNGDEWLSLLPDSNINMVQMIAGEEIDGSQKPVAVCMSKDDVILSQTIKTAAANALGMTKIGTTFTIDPGTTEIKGISLYLEKYQTPSGIIDISIFHFDNSIPSQYPVKNIQLEINQIINGWNMFHFSSTLEVEPGQQYAIVLYVPGGDKENYVKWYYADSNPYTDGLFLAQSKFNAPWLTDETKDLMFQIYSDNRGYRCENLKDRSSEFIGFLNTHESTGNEMNIQTSGIVKGYTSLHKGMGYYFQEDGTISTSPGTGQYAGIAISDSEILMKNDVMWVKDSKGIHNAYEGNVGIGVKDAQAKLQITNLDDSQDAFVVQQKVEGKKNYRMQTISIDEMHSYASDIIPTQNGFFIGGISYKSSNGSLLMMEIDYKGEILWIKNYFNEKYNLRNETYLLTKQGEIIVAGRALYDQNTKRKVFMMKFDQNGKYLWGKLIGTNYYDVQDLFQTTDGNFIITGSSMGQIFIVKIAHNGDFLEEKRYRSSSNLSYYSSTILTDDSIIVVSNYEKDLLLLQIDKNLEVQKKQIIFMRMPKVIKSVVDGFLILGNTGSLDKTELIKLNQNFEFQWGKHINYNIHLMDFCISANNEFIIVGLTQTGSEPTKSISLIKLNQEHNIQWIRNYGGDTHIETIKAHDNGIIFGGFSNTSDQKNQIFLVNADFHGNIENCDYCSLTDIQQASILDFHPKIESYNNDVFVSSINPEIIEFKVEQFEPKHFKNKIMWDGIKNVLTVTKSGKVGIGTETPTHDLQVNGTISSLASYETSDIRFKKDLNPIENALQNIDKATGYRFNLIIVQMNIQK